MRKIDLIMVEEYQGHLKYCQNFHPYSTTLNNNNNNNNNNPTHTHFSAPWCELLNISLFIVSAWAFQIPQHIFYCECHTNSLPRLNIYCLPVSIHLRPWDTVLCMTFLWSISAQQFQNELWGAVSRGSSSVNNLRIVSRVVEEMFCCLPILSSHIPL